MKRFPGLDAPEYVDWKLDQALLDEYRARVESDPDRREVVRHLGEAELLDLYTGLLRNRLHDLTLKRWVRQGVISKAWLGTGEEASTIGPVHALRRAGADRDIVAPMIRNAGACHQMGMPVAAMLRGYLGTADSPSGGRDGHVGDLRHGVVPPISHLGDMVPVSAGIALSFKQSASPRVVLTWIGDGSTRTAAFHEGFNLAAVQRLPLVCIIQNNQVALGTRLDRSSSSPFSEWPRMYGPAGCTFGGNHVLDAYAATWIAVDRVRAGEGPALMVTETFRMGGHATHDEREARSILDGELFDYSGRRDPIGLFEGWLRAGGISGERLASVEKSVTEEVDRAAAEPLGSRDAAMPEGDSAGRGVCGELPAPLP